MQGVNLSILVDTKMHAQHRAWKGYL